MFDFSSLFFLYLNMLCLGEVIFSFFYVYRVYLDIGNNIFFFLFYKIVIFFLSIKLPMVSAVMKYKIMLTHTAVN